MEKSVASTRKTKGTPKYSNIRAKSECGDKNILSLFAFSCQLSLFVYILAHTCVYMCATWRGTQSQVQQESKLRFLFVGIFLGILVCGQLNKLLTGFVKDMQLYPKLIMDKFELILITL